MKYALSLLLVLGLLLSGKAQAQTDPTFNLYPNYGMPGQKLDVVVTGTGHLFDQGSTTLLVGFQQVSSTIHVLNDSVFMASMKIASAVRPGDYDVTIVTHYRNYPLPNAFHIVDSLPVLPGSISGTVFNDLTQNCSQDPFEPGIARRVVRAMPGPYYAVTDSAGQYRLHLPLGTYTVNRLTEDFYDPACQLDGLITSADTVNPNAAHVDFADIGYSCNLQISVLGTDLPPSTCQRDAQAQIEVRSRPSATMRLYQWVQNGFPTGPDSVWYEIQLWQRNNPDPTTAHSPADTVKLDLFKGKYRLEAFTDGGCSDATEFSITEDLMPACSVDIVGGDTAHYTIYPGCHYPMDIWATTLLGNDCETAQVNLYDVDSNGHIIYVPDSVAVGVTAYNGFPVSFHGEWGGDGGVLALVAVAQSGCRDTAYARLHLLPYHPTLHDSTYLDTNQLGVIEGTMELWGCERPDVYVKRLSDGETVYFDVFNSNLHFRVANLVNGGYEVISQYTGYYTDRDTVFITGARDSTLTVNQGLAGAGAGLRVFPIPAHRELRIALTDTQIKNLDAMDVVDSKGSTRRVACHLAHGVGVLDVSALKPGIYVVRLGGKTARFVKE